MQVGDVLGHHPGAVPPSLAQDELSERPGEPTQGWPVVSRGMSIPTTLSGDFSLAPSLLETHELVQQLTSISCLSLRVPPWLFLGLSPAHSAYDLHGENARNVGENHFWTESDSGGCSAKKRGPLQMHRGCSKPARKQEHLIHKLWAALDTCGCRESWDCV